MRLASACLRRWPMIVGAKALALVLKRPDSYYDGDEARDD